MLTLLTLLVPLVAVSGYQDADTVCSPALSGVDLVHQRGYDLHGKVAVITGADSGIGYGAAMAIATAGARLIILAHNPLKARAAAANITRDTGNSNITVVPLDLLSLRQVRQAASTVLALSHQIDVLVCDAGQNYQITGHELSADGFESTFQATFLGHFVLTESLLPALRKSNGRVVNAGCDSNGFINTSYSILVPSSDTVCIRSDASPNCTQPEELDRMLRRPLPTVNSTYAFLGSLSRLYLLRSNLMLTAAHFMKTFYARELAARRNGLPAYVAHPGLVATPGLPATNVNTDVFCPFPQAWYACNCWTNGTRAYEKSVCPLSPLRGSNTLAFLSTAPAHILQTSKGHFFAACEVQRAPIDQFDSMIEANGEEAAMAYARKLTSLWRDLASIS